MAACSIFIRRERQGKLIAYGQYNDAVLWEGLQLVRTVFTNRTAKLMTLAQVGSFFAPPRINMSIFVLPKT